MVEDKEEKMNLKLFFVFKEVKVDIMTKIKSLGFYFSFVVNLLGGLRLIIFFVEGFIFLFIN